MQTTQTTSRHLHLVPAAKTRKVSGDRFRTDAAQDEFRRRWNAAQAKLAK